MSRNNRSFTISNLICPSCGSSFPIPRLRSNARERGHIKDIYCPFCNRTEKMLEIREQDFVLETKQNNCTGQNLKTVV